MGAQERLRARGSFVALRTDMYKDCESSPERFKRTPFPGWKLETIKFLYERRHVLKSGHYQIEVMANLDQLPAKGALIVVTWPKVKDGLGFPARAFAIVP